MLKRCLFSKKNIVSVREHLELQILFCTRKKRGRGQGPCFNINAITDSTFKCPQTSLYSMSSKTKIILPLSKFSWPFRYTSSDIDKLCFFCYEDLCEIEAQID